MIRLLRLMLRWFPDRRFVFVGDSAYGTHEVARFCHRHRDRLCLVSKLHPEANLFEPPPPYNGKGRPRVKGKRRPKPREAVSAARRHKRLTVGWYGGGTRRVETVTGTGHWYKAGEGLVPILWVFVRDREGTHRDEYFYTTDVALAPGRSSGITPAAGTSRPPSKRPAPACTWRRPGAGAGRRCCASPRACSVCTRS